MATDTKEGVDQKGYTTIKTDSFFVESIESDPILYGLHYKKFYFFFVIVLISFLLIGFVSAAISSILGSLGIPVAIVSVLYFLSRLYTRLKNKSGIKRVPLKKRTIRVTNKKTSSYYNGSY